MAKKYFFILSLLWIQVSLRSGNLSILTTNNGWERYAGYIGNLEIEITPDNHYARVDMTFNVYVDSVNYYQGYYYYSQNLPNYHNQSLEAQMQFNMPKGAYFYDSYLWLNPSTIIRAKIMGFGEASRVYDSIVNRRSDPSILRKSSYDGTYSLNIFPISTTFSRKVKISFALPLQLGESKKEYVELPTDFLQFINANEYVKLIFNKTSDKTTLNPVFPLSSKFISESNQSKIISISVQDLNKLNKAYLEIQSNNMDIISFYSQSRSNLEGYYDLRIHASLLPNLSKNISAFQIEIPMLPNGIIYNNLNENNGELNLKEPYHECGQYYGDINYSDSIKLIYKVDNKVYTYKQAIKPTNKGEYIYQNWTNMYCNHNTNEDAVKASLANRVLSTQTAFLALENGDTVSSTKNNNMTGGTTDNSSILSINHNNISIYPNPIVDKFTISAENKILSIRIYSIAGKEVYYYEPKSFIKEIELNSLDIQLEQGIYLITVETEIGVETFRVVKE